MKLRNKVAELCRMKGFDRDEEGRRFSTQNLEYFHSSTSLRLSHLYKSCKDQSVFEQSFEFRHTSYCHVILPFQVSW